MPPATLKPNAAMTHPSGDNRFKILEATMKRQQYQPDKLIEVLHKAQELFGYLSADVLLHVANRLKLPPSRVYGVATFYHFFSLAPQGEHTCVICLGTACYVKGAATLLAAAEHVAGIKAGATTPANRLSLMTAGRSISGLWEYNERLGSQARGCRGYAEQIACCCNNFTKRDGFFPIGANVICYPYLRKRTYLS